MGPRAHDEQRRVRLEDEMRLHDDSFENRTEASDLGSEQADSTATASPALT